MAVSARQRSYRNIIVIIIAVFYCHCRSETGGPRDYICRVRAAADHAPFVEVFGRRTPAGLVRWRPATRAVVCCRRSGRQERETRANTNRELVKKKKTRKVIAGKDISNERHSIPCFIVPVFVAFPVNLVTRVFVFIVLTVLTFRLFFRFSLPSGTPQTVSYRFFSPLRIVNTTIAFR